ncbi:MAG: hypothetical protein K0R46_1305 [Herbinix sp.]|jgi:hypothetical protein|nr:hypothetical protein [Herbinix sp.]
MKREHYSKLINALGILFIILFVIVMIIEISNFSPYNTRMPFFMDRILEFLLPSILCFILARISKNKYK